MSPLAVHHVTEGPEDAPVVLLSNSLGSTYAMWDAQVAALAECFRVVRYDTRGHGRSPVPPGPYTIDDLVDDAVALLDRLEVQRAHVVGLSLGGMTGLRLAAREPDRVDRLVVLCTGARLEPPSGWTDRAATVRAHGTQAVAGPVVQRWFTPAFLEENAAARGHYEAMVAATPTRTYEPRQGRRRPRRGGRRHPPGSSLTVGGFGLSGIRWSLIDALLERGRTLRPKPATPDDQSGSCRSSTTLIPRSENRARRVATSASSRTGPKSAVPPVGEEVADSSGRAVITASETVPETMNSYRMARTSLSLVRLADRVSQHGAARGIARNG